MPSIGSDKVVVRFPTVLLAEFMAELDKRNLNTRREHWSTSDGIRAAVNEWIRKRRASRRRSKTSSAARRNRWTLLSL